MKRALITIAAIGILAPAAWVAGANAQYGSPPPSYGPAPAYGPSQAYNPSQRYTAEPTVDLPVSPPAVLSSTPRALVRRPMTFLGKQLPKARGSGTRALARVNAALCASNTPISVAVTATRSRARLLRRLPDAEANGG
jgi:hypothetical protein